MGGGNTAVEEALFLTKFASKVTIIHRRNELRATKILQERAFANTKIDYLWNSVVTAISGKNKVEGIKVQNLKDKRIKDFACDGVFIFVGYVPNTDFLKGTITLDDDGCVVSDENMKTSKEGVFACGDVRKKPLRQIITASADGAVAAESAKKYIDELKGTIYK